MLFKDSHWWKSWNVYRIWRLNMLIMQRSFQKCKFRRFLAPTSCCVPPGWETTWEGMPKKLSSERRGTSSRRVDPPGRVLAFEVMDKKLSWERRAKEDDIARTSLSPHLKLWNRRSWETIHINTSHPPCGEKREIGFLKM